MITIEKAEEIAQSQFVWAILFIFLLFLVIGYLFRTSEKREQKLMDFHEQSKKDSNLREEKLMNHLEKTTGELKSITDNMGQMQNIMGNMQEELTQISGRMDNLEKGKK